MRFIVLVGSIMSGLGKGIASASIAKILSARGFNVGMIKFDGYLNVDCGTMNPFRHGEVFVLDDGSEVDMDFGTYERFLNIDIKGSASITGGKLFKKIIEKERKGEYLGRDVQFIPHLTNEIKEWVKKEAEKKDVVIIEVGGTVGDLENSYFIEAMRQLRSEQKHFCAVQLTYVPTTENGEQKTKPTQHATKLLQSLGLPPDVIICRTTTKMKKEVKEKIALYCNVQKEDIFEDPLLKSIYELPLIFEREGIYKAISKRLKLPLKRANLKRWTSLVRKIGKGKRINIGVVGKYITVKDAYASVKEAIVHAGVHTNSAPHIQWIDAEEIEKKGTKMLKQIDGIIVPGGFGKRGIEGKIKSIEYARKNRKPYLGLCLGMQLMAVEYARNVLEWDAHSEEFEKEKKAVVELLPEQEHKKELGGTMRKGAIEIEIKKGTKTYEAYGGGTAKERHRHRYAISKKYEKELEEGGLIISGRAKKDRVVEIIEWKEGFGVGTQAHIEFRSRLERPAPLFKAFLDACLKSK